MEEELNYLSDKIESVEHGIDLVKYGITLGSDNEENLRYLEKEKRMLESILNKLTQIELEQ